MKNVVFMIGTEYHLLMSIGIIRNYFHTGYNIILYRVSHIKGKRLKDVDLSKANIDSRDIIYDYNNPTKDLKLKLDEIVNLNPSCFFFFLENKYWINYLFSKLHKNGTKIILGPDGMKAYSEYKTSTALILKEYVMGVYCIIKSRMYSSLPFVEKKYATSKYIDEIWIENKSAFINSTNKKVFEFHIKYDDDLLLILNDIFCVKNVESMKNENKILFLDSSYTSNLYYNYTTDILRKIQDRFPEKKIVIKLHQISSETAKKRYSILRDVSFLESRYPAELYIANAKDCIIVALISTSLLFNNPKCKYYWIYPMYNDMFDYSNVKNPTNHIKVVNSVSEL